MVVITLFATTIALSAYAYSSYKQVSNWNSSSISVSGLGEVTAVPDVATFSFSVQDSGEEVSAVQQAAAETVNAIISYLNEEGIAETDIKTEYYNIMPKFRYDTEPCFDRFCPSAEPQEDGFEVMQTVSVKVRDTDTAGQLISAIGDRGATNVSGLTFTIDDESSLKAEARAQAIANAKEQAEALAEQLGVRLGEIINFYEDEGGYPIQPFYRMEGDMMARSFSEVTPELPMGESTVSSRVTLIYTIK